MGELQIFIFAPERTLRTIDVEGVVWFVAVDVLDHLEFGPKRITEVLGALDEDEKAEYGIPVLSSNGVTQTRNMNCVNISGLFHLIFKSRKPAAQRYRRWVTSEVLPVLEETGTYTKRQAKPLPAPKLPRADASRLNWQHSIALAEALATYCKQHGSLAGTPSDVLRLLEQTVPGAWSEAPGYPKGKFVRLYDLRCVWEHEGLSLILDRLGGKPWVEVWVTRDPMR